MKNILIYQDYVHNNGSLFKALSEYHNVRYVDADDIVKGILNKNIAAFFMPGGASRYVADKLDGLGNSKIKEYVSQGGTYVGICAGAYYGCRRTEWQSHKQTIMVDNELAFFPGTAKGPINQFVNDNHHAAIVPLLWQNDSKQDVFYWGGCSFHPDQNASFNVLATYQDSSPAIVEGSFGQGSYVLISPHLEIDNAQLDLMNFDVIDNRYADIATMKKIERLTTDGFKKIVDRLLK